MTELLYPGNGATVSTLTETGASFFRAYRGARFGDLEARRWIMPEGEDEFSATRPAALTLGWTGDGEPEIAYDGDFSSPAPVTVLDRGDGSVTVTNLLTDTLYFWRVGDSETRSFRTADDPVRLIYADRLKNVRDMGGKRTRDGRRVKQGMIYRGIRLEHHMGEWEEITEAGIATMRDTLGIKSEVDLRDDAVGSLDGSPLGRDVRYRVFPFYDLGSVLTDEGIRGLYDMFSTLVLPDAFPAYIHCAAGADRTGCGAAFLLAALGVSEEDIYLDFLGTVPSLIPDERINWKSPPFSGDFARAIRERYGEPEGDVPTLMRRLVFSLGIPEKELAGMIGTLLE